jgi:hypothetical protein
MFKLVETKTEHEMFADFWRELCSEKQFTETKSAPCAQKYFIVNDKGLYVGIVEFQAYAPEIFSTVEEDFAFMKVEKVRKNREKTFEIDKIGILKEYRSQGFLNEIFAAILHHTETNDVDQYIGLIDSVFYRSLRGFYAINIERVEIVEKKKKINKIINGKSTLYPILFEVSNIENMKEVTWLQTLLSTKTLEV